jgi:hypothetical protein
LLVLNCGGESAENFSRPEAVLLNPQSAPRPAHFAAKLSQAGGVIKLTERGSAVSLLESMILLLEYIGVAALVVVSLGGFAAAVAWTFAVWFGRS